MDTIHCNRYAFDYVRYSSVWGMPVSSELPAGAGQSRVVQGLELGLALVELLVVSLLDGHSCVCLVHRHREVIPDTLHSQVLSH